MAERRKRPELRRIADQDVEPSIAHVEGRGELVDLDKIPEVERHQGSAAAGGADLVVDLFETARGARRQHQMRAFTREARGDRGADAARRAGDERDLASEAAGHQARADAVRRWMTVSAMMLNSAVAIR